MNIGISTPSGLPPTMTGVSPVNSSETTQVYLTQENMRLHHDNRDLREKVANLMKQLAEKENEEDRYDERIRYMKGLMQNLNQVRELTTKIASCREKVCVQYGKMCARALRVDIDVTIFLRFNSSTVLAVLTIMCVSGACTLTYMSIYVRAVFYHHLIYYFCFGVMSFLVKSDGFVIYKPWGRSGHDSFRKEYDAVKMSNDLEVIRIRELKKEVEEIEKSCLTLDHWISDV